MKINLNEIDRDQFIVNESEVYGEKLYLVQPKHIGVKWTRDNTIFRSSIWNQKGELVSAGLRKFVNWNEQSEVFPVPTSLNNTTAVEKIDGSLLIISRYKGQYIYRTRGTFDAKVHGNGWELEQFIECNRQFLAELPETHNYSFLFEWVSPENRIIMNYGDKSDWYLIGVVCHDNYGLVMQDTLDMVAKSNGWKRPQTINFNSVEDLINAVDQWKGKEGVCLYSKDDQEIHKIKSAWYLALHRLKGEISDAEKLVDVWIAWDMPEYGDFQRRIIAHFDYELFTQIQGDVSRICEAKEEAQKIVNHIAQKIPAWKAMTRKDAALDIISSYGQTKKKAVAFSMLDGKQLDNEVWKTLVLQCLN